MEFASPKWGNRLTVFRANDSCWRIKCVDRSFIMLSHIWVSVRYAINGAARYWISRMVAQRVSRSLPDFSSSASVAGRSQWRKRE
jgi:hypothetical protein